MGGVSVSPGMTPSARAAGVVSAGTTGLDNMSDAEVAASLGLEFTGERDQDQQIQDQIMQVRQAAARAAGQGATPEQIAQGVQNYRNIVDQLQTDPALREQWYGKRNFSSAIGDFVDSIGGPAGLFALTAGGVLLAGGGLGAAGGAKGAGGLASVKAPVSSSLLAPTGSIGQAGIIEAGLMSGGVTPSAATTLVSGGGGLGAALSSAAGKVGSVISSAAGALGGGGSMPGLGTLLLNAGTQIVGGLIQQKAAEKAIKNQAQMLTQADAAQAEASRKALEEVKAANLQAEELLAPYMSLAPENIQRLNLYQTAGTQALQQQSALAGLEGPEAQRAAIANLEANPEFQAIARQGEEAILANAAATGGLRGGNTQAALAQFRPKLLQAYIEQQYSRLGGLSGQGLDVSTGLLDRGFGAISDIANLRTGTGATAAKLALGSGEDLSQTLTGLGGLQASREAAQATLPSSILKGANTILGDIFARSPAATTPTTQVNIPGVAFPTYTPGAINPAAGGGLTPTAPVPVTGPVTSQQFFGSTQPGINIGAGGGMAPGNVFAPAPPNININAGLQTPII